MRRKLLLSLILFAVHSVAWAQGTAYAKLTNGDEVSWVAIQGTISDTEIADIRGFLLTGVLDLSQVYTDEGGTGTALRVTSIGSFMLCDDMTGVTIPSSVTSIGSDLFEGCTALSTIAVDAGNGTYNDGNGSNVIIETASNTLMIGCKGSVIPSGVTTIAERAFVRSRLTSIL